MKKIAFIVLTLFLISCNKEEYYKKEIIGGDWVFIPDEPKPNSEGGDDVVRLVNITPPGGHICYSFLDSKMYEDKRGFYKRVEGKSYDDRKSYFLGNESKYEIKGNSLRLYDLKDEKWNSFGIIDLKSDTLSLSTLSGYTIRFNRKRYNFKNKADFDKIIISSSGCYGTCPVSSVLIDKSGEVIFEGLYYTTVNGLYKSKITKNKFDEIIKSFQKADWLNLKESYEASHTDSETITVIFIKNNKIVKTVSDYGHEAPQEFRWAYQPLRFLYQQIKLEKFEEGIDDSNLNIDLLRKQRNYPYPKLN